MVQQLLFSESEQQGLETPKKARPKVTGFRLEELIESLENQENHQEPQKPISVLKNVKWPNPLSVLDRIGKNVRGTWAAPILGLLAYALLIGCGVIAVFYLIGGIFTAIGFLLGGALNLALKYPFLLFILLCLIGGAYFLVISKQGEEPAEVKPLVEDNTGLFD